MSDPFVSKIIVFFLFVGVVVFFLTGNNDHQRFVENKCTIQKIEEISDGKHLAHLSFKDANEQEYYAKVVMDSVNHKEKDIITCYSDPVNTTRVVLKKDVRSIFSFLYNWIKAIFWLSIVGIPVIYILVLCGLSKL